MEDFQGFMSKNRRRRSSGGDGSSSRVLSMAMGGEEEFEEEDVWSILKETETPAPEVKIPESFACLSSSSSSSASWHIPSTKRMAIKESSNEASSRAKQLSAPMNVPDWSKVYGSKKKKKNTNKKKKHLGSWVDDDDDDDGSMVPPHEWIARKLARAQISSFSMCEGIGRTLKGRDLSEVRNAVLAKTGFLE